MLIEKLYQVPSFLWSKFPKGSTAPFCPSEVRQTIPVPLIAPFLTRFRRYAGIGFLISVGYMDPGNWATDLEAGSRFGYALLSVVLLSSLIAILLQTLCVRLGMASGRDLAQLCAERFSARWNILLWAFAQIAIIACDFAEVLGTALALKLLLGLPLSVGIVLTAFDTFIVLLLQGRGLLKIEAIVTALVAIIAISFAAEIFMSKPDWVEVARGLLPHAAPFRTIEGWVVAIGILGATVMPHNLYLHSSLVGSRKIAPGQAAKEDAIRLLTLDTLVTLSLALLVNAAILIVAASVFHFSGHGDVIAINDAYHLLTPLLGATAASTLFALALLASGQSSTLTGTIAGQVILQGFLKLRIPCWQQRFLTRVTAVLPAWFAIAIWGESSLEKLLIVSQIVLSMQLPFAVVPLILFNNDQAIMGPWKMSAWLRNLCWLICIAIIAANIFLLYRMCVA